MPFLQTDEELEKQNSAGQISGPSAGPMSSAAPKKAGSPASSGSWVNLQKYVDANKQQANQMGDAVVGTADAAGEQAQTATQNFQAKVPEKTKQYSAQDLETQYYSNPNANKNDYQNVKTTGGYTGPKSLEEAGYGAAESAVSKANEKLNNLQTEQGRQQILGEVYGKPSYTGGQKTFDNLLLQNTSGVQNKVADANNRWGGLTGMLADAKQQASEVIPQNIATAAQNMQTATQAEQDYVNKFYGNIEAQAAAKNAENLALQDKYKSDLSNSVVSPETLALLGLQNNQNIYDVNFQDYLQNDYTQLGAKDVATDAQRAQWSNLMNLIGGNDQRLAGTALSVNPVSVDKNKLSADLAAKSAQYDPEIQNIMDAVYGGGSGGGFSQAASGSMKEMLDMGLDPDSYIALKRRQNPDFGWNTGEERIRADYEKLMKINKKINSNQNNFIARPSGGITGSLKG